MASLPLALGPERTCPLEPPIVSSLTVSPLLGVQSAATSAWLSAFKSNAAGPTCGADARTCSSLLTHPAVFVQSHRGIIRAGHHPEQFCRPYMSYSMDEAMHLCNDLACCFSSQAAAAELMHSLVQLSLLLIQLDFVICCPARDLHTGGVSSEMIRMLEVEVQAGCAATYVTCRF